MKYPTGLDIDPLTGNVVVGDRENNRLEYFDPSLTYVSQFGATGRADGQIQNPRGVAFDPNGNLWVGDSFNDRLQRFGDAPQVQITSPVSGAILTDTTPVIEYTVTDPAASCDIPSGGEAGPFTNGPQSFTVVCSNARGSGSATVGFTVDAPVASLPKSPPALPGGTIGITIGKKMKLRSSLRLTVICSQACTVDASIQYGKRTSRFKSKRLAGRPEAQTVRLKLAPKLVSKLRKLLKSGGKASLKIKAGFDADPSSFRTGTARFKS
jgi:hypothetical protein